MSLDFKTGKSIGVDALQSEVRIARVPLGSALAEAEPLLRAHWQETTTTHDMPPLDIDWELLVQLERMGMLYVFTARDAGRLVGYLCIVRSVRHFNHRGAPYANDVGFYVAPSHRRLGVGAALLMSAEDALRQDGVFFLTVSTKTAIPVDRLMVSCGYRHEENVYLKSLKADRCP
jgi:GNAT superfamily N-acetyltransferase